MPAPHPPEFRRRAVELARRGDTPLAQLAQDLGVSRSCLQNWMRQADADEKPDSEGPEPAAAASAVGDEGAAWAINLAVAERQIRKRPRRGTPAAPVQVPLP
jgi:transposase-like protein